MRAVISKPGLPGQDLDVCQLFLGGCVCSWHWSVDPQGCGVQVLVGIGIRFRDEYEQVVPGHRGKGVPGHGRRCRIPRDRGPKTHLWNHSTNKTVRGKPDVKIRPLHCRRHQDVKWEVCSQELHSGAGADLLNAGEGGCKGLHIGQTSSGFGGTSFSPFPTGPQQRHEQLANKLNRYHDPVYRTAIFQHKDGRCCENPATRD